MLQRIDANSRTTQGIVIAPTRELCLQISKELTKYASKIKGLQVVAIYGGAITIPCVVRLFASIR